MWKPPAIVPIHIPRFNAGLTLRTLYRSSHMGDCFHPSPYASSTSRARPDCNAAYAASAASIPDFIALWVPLIRGTLRNPAEQPINAPPGNATFGTDCSPPSLMARAP